MDYRFHAELAIMAANWAEFCRELNLTEEQMKDPNGGRYAIDRWHQIQTAYNMRKGALERAAFPKTQTLPQGGGSRGEEKTDAEGQ